MLPSAARPEEMSWSVGALLLAVADQLTARFGAVTVRGEISGFTRASSGHCYFSLKDASGAPGLVRCAMFRRAATLLDFAPADGQGVVLRGRLAVYEPRGELQLVVESMQRLGAGTLYEEFLRLRARLAAQGLFDEARRRPIPRHPSVVGVVTSPDAAAWRDVMTTLARRAPHVRVVLYPSLVQGAQAPGEIVAALVTAARRRATDLVDVLLLVRGGGSLEDLWAFNDERVVRAVAASPVPLICGVGHETDVTLADLAADLRAATPTAAAELAVPDRGELLAALRTSAARLQRAALRQLDREGQRLDLLGHRAGAPASRLSVEEQRLAGLGLRLGTALRRRVMQSADALLPQAARLRLALRREAQRQGRELEGLAGRLRAAHPQQVLSRGFAWVLDAQGGPVMHAANLRAGQSIEAVFADGRASAMVTGIRLPPPPGGDAAGQMGAPPIGSGGAA